MTDAPPGIDPGRHGTGRGYGAHWVAMALAAAVVVAALLGAVGQRARPRTT